MNNEQQPAPNRLPAGICIFAILAGSLFWLSHDGWSSRLFVYKQHGFELLITNGEVKGVLLASDAPTPRLKPGSLAMRVDTHGFRLGMTESDVLNTIKDRGYTLNASSGNREIAVNKETQITLGYNNRKLVDEIAIDGHFSDALGINLGSTEKEVTGRLGKPDYIVTLKKPSGR